MASYSTQPINGIGIDRLAWMEGGWGDYRNGNHMEEFWSGPAAGTMVGMFRWIKGDDLRFYELIVLEEFEDGVVMRIKHFNRGFEPWEQEHVLLHVVDLQERRAVFFMEGTEKPTWLVYERTGPDTLEAWFEYAGDGSDRGMEFQFDRIDSKS